jgi:hypothetical protein
LKSDIRQLRLWEIAVEPASPEIGEPSTIYSGIARGTPDCNAAGGKVPVDDLGLHVPAKFLSLRKAGFSWRQAKERLIRRASWHPPPRKNHH